MAKAKERLAETFLKAVSLECYNLVGSNAELNVPMTFSSANGYFDSIESREKTVVSYFNFRQDPGKKDVAFWLWGNSHVEKHRIPFFLHRAYPGAKVVSVVLNGGRFNPSYSFDRVLKKLGWLDRAFILRLDGFREADYVIHLPTYGRQDRSKSMEQEFFPQYPVLMPMVAPPL